MTYGRWVILCRGILDSVAIIRSVHAERDIESQ